MRKQFERGIGAKFLSGAELNRPNTSAPTSGSSPSEALYMFSSVVETKVEDNKNLSIFSGHFRHNLETGELIGMGVDPFGLSYLKGEADEDIIQFAKYYSSNLITQSHPTIHYHLRRIGKLWIGNYIVSNPSNNSLRGRVELLLVQTHNNAAGLISDHIELTNKSIESLSSPMQRAEQSSATITSV